MQAFTVGRQPVEMVRLRLVCKQPAAVSAFRKTGACCAGRSYLAHLLVPLPLAIITVSDISYASSPFIIPFKKKKKKPCKRPPLHQTTMPNSVPWLLKHVKDNEKAQITNSIIVHGAPTTQFLCSEPWSPFDTFPMHFDTHFTLLEATRSGPRIPVLNHVKLKAVVSEPFFRSRRLFQA